MTAIDRLIAALAKERDWSAEQIAEILWLALEMQGQEGSARAGTDSLRRQEPEQKVEEEPRESETKIALPKNQFSQDGEDKKSSQASATGGIYLPTPGKNSGLSLPVPDAPSLRQPLSLARALRPLLYRACSGRFSILDERATVRRIADEKIWMPVFKPALEPWFDLALVVEESESMLVWRRTVVELERVLKNYGIFRNMQTWELVGAGEGKEKTRIRRRTGKAARSARSLRSPKELADPSGRTLVLVVSDCSSPIWKNGAVLPALQVWGNSGPMAVLQMLPEWLWKKTGLAWASAAWLRGLNPGAANRELRVNLLSAWDEIDLEAAIKIPVFTLEVDFALAWSQMVAAKGNARSPGFVFDSAAPSRLFRRYQERKETRAKQKAEQQEAERLAQANLTEAEKADRQKEEQFLKADKLVRQFRLTASPMARKLAGLLAAAPVISFPTVRLIQKLFLQKSSQVHVAEVFMGGLLEPQSPIKADTNPDTIRYEFIDKKVRDILLDSVPTSDAVSIVDKISIFFAKSLGLSIDTFAAVLQDPEQSPDKDVAGQAEPFATATAQVLRRLGGEYALFAQRLEESWSSYSENNVETTSEVDSSSDIETSSEEEFADWPVLESVKNFRQRRGKENFTMRLVFEQYADDYMVATWRRDPYALRLISALVKHDSEFIRLWEPEPYPYAELFVEDIASYLLERLLEDDSVTVMYDEEQTKLINSRDVGAENRVNDAVSDLFSLIDSIVNPELPRNEGRLISRAYWFLFSIYLEDAIGQAILNTCSRWRSITDGEYWLDFLRQIASNPEEIKAIGENYLLSYQRNRNTNIIGYFKRAFTKEILVHLEGEFGIHRASPWRHLCTASKREIISAMNWLALNETEIKRRLFALDYFKSAYQKGRINSTMRKSGDRWPNAERQEFEETANYYNDSKELRSTMIEVRWDTRKIDWQTIENWIEEIIRGLQEMPFPREITTNYEYLDYFDPSISDSDPSESAFSDEISSALEEQLLQLQQEVKQQIKEGKKPEYVVDILSLRYAMSLSAVAIGKKFGVNQSTISRDEYELIEPLLQSFVSLVCHDRGIPVASIRKDVEEWLIAPESNTQWSQVIRDQLRDVMGRTDFKSKAKVILDYYWRKRPIDTIAKQFKIEPAEVERRLKEGKRQLETEVLIGLWTQKSIPRWMAELEKAPDSDNPIHREFVNCIYSLEPQQRQAWLWHHRENMPEERIAQKLNASEAEVRSTLDAANQQLYRVLLFSAVEVLRGYLKSWLKQYWQEQILPGFRENRREEYEIARLRYSLRVSRREIIHYVNSRDDSRDWTLTDMNRILSELEQDMRDRIFAWTRDNLGVILEEQELQQIVKKWF